MSGDVEVQDLTSLMPEREDFQVEQGAGLEEAGQRGEHGEYDSFHPGDANARGQEKSTGSTSTGFLVGPA